MASSSRKGYVHARINGTPCAYSAQHAATASGTFSCTKTAGFPNHSYRIPLPRLAHVTRLRPRWRPASSAAKPGRQRYFSATVRSTEGPRLRRESALQTQRGSVITSKTQL